MATITIPDFNFAAFYYPELLNALVQYKRVNVPEHSDESPYDPFMQLCRMMALVGHLNNVNLDLVANESTLPTAKLQETVRNMLRLIDYEMSTASPSVVELVYKLSKVFLAPYLLIPERAQASIEPGAAGVIYFENLAALTIARTDQFTKVFGKIGAVWTDFTAQANDQTPSTPWGPWGVGAPAVKDAIYFGHGDAMWIELAVALLTMTENVEGVWEYYNGNFRKAQPTEVIDMGGYLRVRLDDYLGSDPKVGTLIRVMLNETTAYQDLESEWSGGDGNFVVTTGYLGQTLPSIDAEDYSVGSDWEELPDLNDGTAGLTVTGTARYSLPQTVTRDWAKGVVNQVAAYWVRWRVTRVDSLPVPPVFDFARLDTGAQYVLRECTQGRTQNDLPLGSSGGTANQQFRSTQDFFIAGSGKVYVDDELWTVVSNFLNSQPTDKHCQIQLTTNDRAIVVFGDGVAGKIPPSGVGNISFNYRHAANTDGNVGANTVVMDKTGLTYVDSLWNPRLATGWTEAEGASEASLERAKIAGPASLRTKEVALNGDDVVEMAEKWVAVNGASPVSRARAFEGGFGPKTIELVIVLAGGGQGTAEQITELNTYFNGDQEAHPIVRKRVIANQQVVAVNYTPKVIDVEATVYGQVNIGAVENALRQVLQPEAMKPDGVNYEWEFGEAVPVSRITHEIFETSEDITRVDVTVPASNVPLTSRELPVLGTVTLTIVEG